MNCTSCGQTLPTEVAFCPNCGAPAPYNMPRQGSSSPNAPTEAFSYGNPPSYPSLPPTIAANPGSYGPPAPNPYTAYGADAPPQTPYPYNIPSAYPGANPPPFPNQPPSGPYYGPPPGPGMQQPGYAPGMQPDAYGMPSKKKSNIGLIIGIIVLVVLLLCAGVAIGAAQLTKSAVSTINKSIAATSTSATTNTANVPAISNIVPAAAKILYGVQTSSAIDKDYNPQQLTTTFAAGKDVNLTFQINSAGKNGFIQVKWYEDGQQTTSDILKHSSINNHGYFVQTYDTAGNGAAAIYWCTQSNCSDAQLAQTVTFTITGTGTVLSPNRNPEL